MKNEFLIVFLAACVSGVVASTDTVTLNEAEQMVNSGRAFIVKLPSNAILTQIKEDEINASKTLELNRLKMLEANVSKPLDCNVTKVVENNISTIIEINATTSPILKEKAKAVVKPKPGISILMPTTLSSLLVKLAALNNESYFCEDDLNIPPSRVQITDIAHLDRYLRQVSSFGVVIVKDSIDPAIPKVIKVTRTQVKEVK